MSPYFPPAMFYCMADLSHWNAIISHPTPEAFAAAYAYGIRYVALKATQGTGFVDPVFRAWRAAAEAAGMNVLAYAFLDAAPAASQADHLLATIGPLSGLELAIDVEANPGGADGSVTIPLAADVAQRLADKAGFLPFYYGTRFGPDGKGGGLPHRVLSQCPLWLAEWGNQPICPTGWSAWRIWQATNGRLGRDVEPVPGLGIVDRSYIAATSLDEIARWWSRR